MRAHVSNYCIYAPLTSLFSCVLSMRMHGVENDQHQCPKSQSTFHPGAFSWLKYTFHPGAFSWLTYKFHTGAFSWPKYPTHGSMLHAEEFTLLFFFSFHSFVQNIPAAAQAFLQPGCWQKESVESHSDKNFVSLWDM